MACRISVVMIFWVLVIGCGEQGAWAFPGLDASFGLNGRVAVELGGRSSGHAVLVQPDGKILIAGASSQNNILNSSLLRFNSDGTPDPSFNRDGTVITSLSGGDNEALALGLLSDGRIVTAGYAYNGRDRDLAVICYRPDGQLDRTFGDEGVVLTSIGNGNEEITAMTVSPSDMITVAGSTEGTGGRILVVARYTAHGEPDDGFGEQGVSLIAVGEDATAEGILERQDGTFVLSGSYAENKNSSAMLVGLHADGTIDTGFGEYGVAIPAGSLAASEGYGIAADENGRIYVAGAVGLPGKRDSALFRFTAQGMVDPSFGQQGAVITPVSREDDVLYSVDVGADGVAASGFTTDAGTRQFLLLSCSKDGYTTVSQNSQALHGQTTAPGQDEVFPEDASIQEVRLYGGTEVQIRQLQMWNNAIQIKELQTAGSLSAVAPAVASSGAHAEAQVAADGATASTGEGVNTMLPQILTTTFSEGESVSYALTSDRQGNRVAVGAADGGDASSMVAARFVAEEMIDRITDQPGHRSSYIVTVSSPIAVTRDSVTVSGEIAAAFGQDVTRRGVVFSIHPGPLFTGKVSVMGETPIIRRGIDLVTAFFLPEAMAATPTPPRSGSGHDGRQDTSAGRLLTAGEVVASGTGTGGFNAVVEHLMPGTFYYMRAYALTAGGNVYYGNQINVRTADACFIATASFGTFLHPSVGILRDFRDTFLLGNRCGRWLVDLYYRVSPSLAEMVAASAPLRFIGRVLLLPWVGFSWLTLRLGLGITLVGGLASTAVLGGVAARWLRPRH
ncbi:MAG: delta-60 repeat domain-containing protein [Desulfobulbus sp.]|nr:delta-60 repeat domain-containing protein [Desulfobulbus sp.]